MAQAIKQLNSQLINDQLTMEAYTIKIQSLLNTIPESRRAQYANMAFVSYL